MDGFLPAEFVRYYGPATAHEEQTIPNACYGNANLGGCLILVSQFYSIFYFIYKLVNTETKIYIYDNLQIKMQ